MLINIKIFIFGGEFTLKSPKKNVFLYMINIDHNLKPADLSAKLKRFWQLSGEKILLIEKNYDESKGSPVFTVNGNYSTRGWTEWTQGFQYGSAILQFDATGEKRFLEYAKKKTLEKMAPHVSHTGVHDHGFNNISTYGNLLRLMTEGKIPFNEWEKNFYELALKISGAVQASRWTTIKDGGFIHSFNGAHSLFVDTIRSVRALTISHMLGHVLQGEGDIKISLLERAIQHIQATRNFSFSMVRAAISMMSGEELPMRASLMLRMEISAVRAPSRDIPDSVHGQEVWPGQCAVLPNSLNGLIQ